VLKRFLAVSLCLLLLLSGCSKDEVETEEVVDGIRYPNLSTTSVDQDGLIYDIVDGQILLDGEVVDTGRLTPADLSTLSIIDNTLYVHSDLGLQRYNIDTKITEPMYYDIMDYSFAGLYSIFFINNLELYSASSPTDVITLDSSLVDSAYFINGNYFYYIAGDMLKALDLVSEEIIEMQPVTSPVTGISIDGGITITTVDGDIVADFLS
jgi:hypothetical protein